MMITEIQGSESTIVDDLPIENQQFHDIIDADYAPGFVTDVESDSFPPGLNEDVVRAISAKKNEPEWMTEWRLKAFHIWQKMSPPDWAKVNFPPIDFRQSAITQHPRR